MSDEKRSRNFVARGVSAHQRRALGIMSGGLLVSVQELLSGTLP
jgi:hypothetical protein